MTEIQQTSIDAFKSIQKGLGKRQAAVLACLRGLGEANNRILAKAMCLPVNVVVPRVFECRAKGLIIESRIMVDPITKRNTIYWKVK